LKEVGIYGGAWISKKGGITMKKLIYLIAILNLCIFSSLLLFSQSKTEGFELRVKALEDSLKVAPESTQFLLELGILCHNVGTEGDKNAVKKSKKILEKLIKLEPENAEAHCWYGSVLTLNGRDAWFPLSKVKYVNDGIKEMDKAVKLAPDNITIRMIRANNNLALPDMFNRTEIAIADFEYLLSMKEEEPEIFEKDLLVEILLNLGNAYKKKGDLGKARKNWQKVTLIAPDSEEALEAKKLLEKTMG
jgi:tetratricopeptide (TPR) repeat protein